MVDEKRMYIYDYSVGICGILVMLILTAAHGLTGMSLWLSLFFIMSEIVIDKFMIHESKISISFSTVFDMTGFITMGLAPALWVRSISIFIVDFLIDKRPLRIAALNIGMFILNISAGGFAYIMAVKLLRITGNKYFSTDMLLPFAAFAAVNLLTNYVCISIHVRITNSGSLKTILSEGLLWDTLSGIISIPLAMVFSDIYLFYNHDRPLFSIIFILPVIFTCFIIYLVGRVVYTNKQLKALSKAALSINSYLDLDRIYNVVFDTINSIVGFKGCYIFEYDAKAETMSPLSCRVDGDGGCNMNDLDMHSEIFMRVVRSNKAFIVNRLPVDKNRIDRNLTYRSCIMVPMRRLNKCVGGIGIFSEEHHRFDENVLEFLMILSDQAAIAIENAKLFKISKEQAITDNLTYLYNQRYFYKYLDSKVEEYSNSSGKLSLIMFDIDHFKAVNDEYGHVAGDYVLKEVAALIRGCVRKNDVVARYGGEEFTVVLPDTEADEAYVIAERVRQKVESHIFTVDCKTIKVTVSGGISEYPEVASSVTQLVNYADRAMYIGAKFNGRNKIKVYDEITA